MRAGRRAVAVVCALCVSFAARAQDQGAASSPSSDTVKGPWHIKPETKKAPPKRKEHQVEIAPATPVSPAPPWATLPAAVVLGAIRPDIAFQVPRSVGVVTRSDMRERAVATTPDALDDLPGVSVPRSALAAGAATIRGLGGRRVLLLVDGLRLDDASWPLGSNQYLATVDPFSLDHIEVLRGPGSVRYGQNALGGVIDMVPVAPETSPSGLHASGDGLFQVASQTWEKSGHARAQVSTDWGAALVGASYRNFENLLTPSGVVSFTGYQEVDLLGRAQARFAGGRVSAMWMSTRQLDVPHTDRCDATVVIDCVRYPEQLRDLVDLRYTRRLGPGTHFSATLYLDRTHEQRDRQRDAQSIVERELADVVTPAVKLGLDTRALPWLVLSLGADGSRDGIGLSASTVTPAGVVTPVPRGRVPDGSSFIRGGLFAEARAEIADAAIFGGARLSASSVWAPASGGLPAVRSDHLAGLASLGARLRVAPGVQVVADVDQGYRAPNVDDLAGLGAAANGYDVPNPALKPERSTSYEVGAKLFRSRVQAQLFAYYTDLYGAVVRTPSTYLGQSVFDGQRVYQRVNTSVARLYGLDGSLALRLPLGFAVGLDASLSMGDDLGRHVPLSGVPPMSARLRVRWTEHTGRFFVEADIAGAANQDRLAPEDFTDPAICPAGPTGCSGTPGYVTIGARGGLVLSHFALLDVRLVNLTNRRYRVHGSALDAPAIGASVRVTVHVE